MSVFSKLSIEDLEVAAAWLLCNEGELGEKESCKRVAEALQAECERREENETIRNAAKAAGVSPALLRKALRKIAKDKP